jgi:hypothetical protein
MKRKAPEANDEQKEERGVLSREAWRMLCLGDGNFSFSNGLATAFPEAEVRQHSSRAGLRL